jgi:carbon monoxide dehydrogenase subunit G
MIDADRDAPVFVSGEVEVDAPAETVWETVTDVESWPRWDPGVKRIATNGARFAEGTQFGWSAGPGMIRSVVVTAERPSRAVWLGYHGGIIAVHVVTITPAGPSTTRVHSEESWSGFLPRVMPKVLQRTLSKSNARGLPAIKGEAERRAHA